MRNGGHRVKTRTLSDGAEVMETIYFVAEALNETHQDQLSKIVSPELDAFFSPRKLYWGTAATIADCFDAEIVDDGVCSVTEFVLEDVKYYYWLARFGGNAAGHVIRGCAPPATAGDILNSRAIFSSLLGGPWVAVAQNVDDDLTWTCPINPAPEGFMERFREVAERG